MKKILTSIAMAIAMASLHAETIVGKTIAVSDGDTITVLASDNTQYKIRFAEIDAPEKNQAFGQASKKSLSDLIYGKTVTVQVQDTDRYQRKVGVVFLNNNDINMEQVKRGMAWFYTQYGKNQKYRTAEQTARSQRIGLWADPNPIPPWDYRHEKKSGGKNDSGLFDLGKVLSAVKPQTSTAAPSCGSKRYCKEMTSCDEAKMYLNQCGAKSLDGNGDGVPCEKLCS